jgi:glycerol-3-phosphate dehydrogenase
VDKVCSVPCRTAVTPLPPRPSPANDLASRVRFACEHEMAMTVSDVMRRRTMLALSPDGGPAMAERVARVMTEARGWNAGEMRWFLQEYVDEWKRNLP